MQAETLENEAKQNNNNTLNKGNSIPAIIKVLEILDLESTKTINTYLGKHIQDMYATKCWSNIQILHHKTRTDLIMIVSIPKSQHKLDEYTTNYQPDLRTDFGKEMITPGLLKSLLAEDFSIEDFKEI